MRGRDSCFVFRDSWRAVAGTLVLGIICFAWLDAQTEVIGPGTISPGAAGETQFKIKAGSVQAGNLLELYNAGDTIIAAFNKGGRASYGGTDFDGTLTAIALGTSVMPLVAKGFTGQTSDLQQWVISSTTVANITKDGALQLQMTAAKPTCDATVRGTYWHTRGGTGVKDSVEVCAKDAADAYAWRTIY